MTALVEAIRRALGEVLAAKPEAVLMGQDVGAHGGLFRATAGLLDRFGATRVLDVPPNAPAMLGLARGMKLAGHLPLVEIPPGESAARAGQALADDIGRMRLRTGGVLAGPFVVRVPVGHVAVAGGATAGLADGDSPEPALARAEGLTVVAPSRPSDAWAMIHAAADHPEPVVVLEPKALYRRKGAPLAPDAVPATDVLSRPRVVRDGKDLTFFAWGAGVPAAVEAAERITADGFECGVVDVRVLRPLPIEALGEALEETGRALVVHDGAGAFAGDVVAALQRVAFLSLEAPIGDVDLGVSDLAAVRDAALAALNF